MFMYNIELPPPAPPERGRGKELPPLHESKTPLSRRLAPTCLRQSIRPDRGRSEVFTFLLFIFVIAAAVLHAPLWNRTANAVRAYGPVRLISASLIFHNEKIKCPFRSLIADFLKMNIHLETVLNMNYS